MSDGGARRLGGGTAGLLVVASMVGTGVFTTSGFLLRDVGSVQAVLLAWVIGGAVALFGALAYAELGSALPVSGGEYALLGRIYHPAVGFTAGWLSMVVGFAAPTAAAAIAFGEYFGAILPGTSPTLAGLVLLTVLCALNLGDVRLSGGFQNAATALKIVLIVAFIGVGLWLGEPSRVLTEPGRPLGDALGAPGFAIGLIYVSYAYSGWNAAAYIAGEVRRPALNLPLGLIGGTLLVTLLYVGLNYVFFAAVPPYSLTGVVEVGHVAAVGLLGEGYGRVVSALIALGLVSTVGALVFAGARVFEAMGGDYRRLGWLAWRREGTGPLGAVAVLWGLSAVMVLTAGFDTLLTYVGITLSLSSALTVAGVTVLRWRRPDLERPYRAWGHPVTSLLFIGLMGWIVWHSVAERPLTGAAAAGTVLAGLLVYGLVRASARSPEGG